MMDRSERTDRENGNNKEARSEIQDKHHGYCDVVLDSRCSRISLRDRVASFSLVFLTIGSRCNWKISTIHNLLSEP